MKRIIKKIISICLLKSEQGQIVLVLLLTMLVGLGIGLTVTQKSITDVTTSTQNEQSSRAFSAAQAGLERALLSPAPSVVVSQTDLGNQSSAVVAVNADKPSPGSGVAVEFPGVTPDLDGQVFLANPTNLAQYYGQSDIDVYFGNASATQSPAAEIIVITQNSGVYQAARYFYDTISRTNPNNFTSCPPNPSPITTTSSTATNDRSFKCKVTVNLGTGTPIMIRVKLLYINDGQSIAVKPNNSGCGTAICELPAQVSVFTSVGTSGQSQKTLQVFKGKTLPYFLDYAIFSASEIHK